MLCLAACWAACAQYSDINWGHPEKWYTLCLSPFTYAFLAVTMFKDKQVYSKEAGGYVTGFKAMKTNIQHSIYFA